MMDMPHNVRSINRDVYRNNLKNQVFDKKALRNSCLERETIVREQGSSEDKNCEVKPTPSETDSSGCSGIYRGIDLAKRIGAQEGRREHGRAACYPTCL